jgi:hypothetical protein
MAFSRPSLIRMRPLVQVQPGLPYRSSPAVILDRCLLRPRLLRRLRTAVSERILGMPHLWYVSGMARTRISTTVDAALLAGARRARSGLADSALIDEALAALLARQRAAEIDAAYGAYDVHPLHEHDEWGDLASFREAAGAS